MPNTAINNRNGIPHIFHLIGRAALTCTAFFILWHWSNYLNQIVFSEDRIFHTLALIDDRAKETEPLWGILGPLIGHYFPGDPFEAASAIAVLLIASGMLLNRYDWLVFGLVAFSPGVAYFLTNALRQGIAVGIFMILLGLIQRKNPISPEPYSPIYVIGLAIPPGLVHNSIAIAAIYLLSSIHLRRYGTSDKRIQLLHICLSIVGVAMLLTAFIPIGGTALLLVAGQWALALGSFFFKPLRKLWTLLVGVFLLAVASGFLFNTTGLRVMIMMSLVAPLAFRTTLGKWLAIAGCWLYPLFLIFFGPPTGELGPWFQSTQ